jgi:hypothetical protein
MKNLDGEAYLQERSGNIQVALSIQLDLMENYVKNFANLKKFQMDLS